jgi:hypothetical protein
MLLLFQRVFGAPTTATAPAAIFAHFLKWWLLPWHMGTCAWERVLLDLCIMGVLGLMLGVLTGHCLLADNWTEPCCNCVCEKPLSWGGWYGWYVEPVAVAAHPELLLSVLTSVTPRRVGNAD